MNMILLFTVLIKLTLITEINLQSITTKTIKSFPSTLIYDVYYSSSDYTLLLQNKIIKGTYNSDSFQEYSYTNIGSAISSVIKIDNYYAVACFGEYLLGLFSISSSNLNLEGNIPYDDTNVNINEPNKKCTISKISNSIIVGIIDDDNTDEAYKIFSFTRSGTSLVYSKYIYTPIAKTYTSIYDKASIKCMGLGNSASKVLCILCQNNGVLKFDIDFSLEQNEQPETEQLDDEYAFNEARVSQCTENTYVVSTVNYDDDGQFSDFQYMTPIIISNDNYQVGLHTLILETPPTTLDIYSGFVQDINNFYIVYLDEDTFLNIEQVKFTNGERTVNSALDIEGFEGTYTYTTRVNNNFEIIVSEDDKFTLVRLTYPDVLTCESDTLNLPTSVEDFEIDVVSGLNMNFARINDGLKMKEFYGLATINDYTYYTALITIDDTTTYQGKNLLFMFFDDDSVYYSHDCEFKINLCPNLFIVDTCVDECPVNSALLIGSEKECECKYYAYTKKDKRFLSCDLFDNIDLYEVILGDECKNKLMSEYSISDENNIIIDKKIIKRENTTSHQLEYKIYKKNGDTIEIIDASVCNNMNVTLKTPLNTSFVGLDLEKLKSTKKENFDIFNPNDDFFHDICIKYSDENDADVPIKVRREEYYHDLPLCESTCTYKGYQFKNNDLVVECDCKYKSFSKRIREFSSIETEEDFKTSDISNNNFKVMKCGKETFKNVEKNSAFWLILFGLLVQIGVFTTFIVFKNKIISILLLDAFGLTLASPPKEDDEKKQITDDDKTVNKENNVNNGNNENNVKIYGEERVSNNEEIVLENDKNTHEGLNNMNFENAIIYDKRGYFSYFCNILMYNQMLLFVIFKDNWNFVVTKISMFVNIITFALLFNIMLFGNKLIKAIYDNKGGLSVKNAIGWIFLASLLTVILNCFAKILGLTKRDVDNAKNNPNFNKEDFSNLIFKRTIIYFIICFIFTFFIWYFGMSFCSIYSNCQKNLIFYIFLTWLIIMIYPFFLCAFIALFRYLGVKKEIKGFYTFSKGLQWIIML